MSAHDELFGKFTAEDIGQFFQMLDGYTPAFTTFDGGVYEMELTRSCIHTFANHCSKLLPKVNGTDRRGLQAMLDSKPNLFHTSAQFVYKAATLYEAQNTCFITPVLDCYDRICGFYVPSPIGVDLRELDGQPFLLYHFGSGQRAAIELERVGTVSKYIYHSDLFGEDNSVLAPTMQLMDTQNQGIQEGVKASAAIRFMATVSNFAKSKDLAAERKRWVEDNLGSESGGLALFPNTYTNIQQIQSYAQTIDPDQMKVIENRVYTYFGTSERILLNQATGDEWSAYYEGKIEPFALQLSQSMTAMTFSMNEQHRGHNIVWSSNRLQYMTNGEKLEVSSQLFDRGILSINQVMDIWQLPHVEDGDKRYIRKEYTEVSQLNEGANTHYEITDGNSQTKDPVNDHNPTEEDDDDPE